jgi:peptidoglycan L-alanyl-D-glutamate endopeptidase CwlK
MFPLVVLVAVGAVLLTRRKQTDGAAPPASNAGTSGAGSSSSASNGTNAVTWNPAWGTPNTWDAKYPGRDVTRPIPYDPAHLDPTFRAKLDATFAVLRSQGWDPKVFEGARSQQRQAWLWGEGRPEFPVYGRAGKYKTKTLDASSHGSDGARATDVISASTAWSNMDFFYALGAAAKAQGLTWGGDWPGIRDYTHVELRR